MGSRSIPEPGCSYTFGNCTLDIATERLFVGDAVVKLRPKSFQVLRYMLEHPGRLVTREELMGAIWGDVVVTDESVTKCIADIRKALGDEDQAIVETVPRRGFLLHAEVVPASRNSLSADELTPPEEESSAGRATPSSARRRFAGLPDVLPGSSFRHHAVLAVAALVLVVGAGVTWERHRSGGHPVYEAIAVLPFEALSTGPDHTYIADGVTEALITSLGEASPLRVIARTSVNQYRKSQKSARDIARELNVDVLVEGTITQSGDHVRVTANLIQVSPERHIWARSYERSFRDVVTLQNEIAGAIAAEIHLRLTPRQQLRLARHRPVNHEAQTAYWKARYFRHGTRSVDAAKKGIEYAEQAVRIDPAYAEAHAELALAYVNLSAMGPSVPGDFLPLARNAAQRASALDDELSEAHVALGSVFLYDWDWAAAERASRRAIALNPSNADARHRLANVLAARGRTRDAVTEIRRARELDPLSFLINRDVGRVLFFARRYDEAITELKQVADMQPNAAAVEYWYVKACLKGGLTDAAVAADLRLRGFGERLSKQSLATLEDAYRDRGLPGYWSRIKDLVLPKYLNLVNRYYHAAEISAYLDDKEEALRWLEKAYDRRSIYMPWVAVDPAFDSLRSDSRFTALVRRMGLAQ